MIVFAKVKLGKLDYAQEVFDGMLKKSYFVHGFYFCIPILLIFGHFGITVDDVSKPCTILFLEILAQMVI